LLQAVQHLVAVHARHHHVEQDQVRLRQLGGIAQGNRARAGSLHSVALRTQQPSDGREVFGYVIYHQDRNARAFK